MKTFSFITFSILFVGLTALSYAQNAIPANKKFKVEVYYFHPNERCPIDHAIEENTIKLIRTDFAKEVADSLLKLQVLNTDEPVNDKIAEQFEINAQALYVVRIEQGQEQKTNLTDFAFATAKNNPAKFLERLKEEIVKALK